MAKIKSFSTNCANGRELKTDFAEIGGIRGWFILFLCLADFQQTAFARRCQKIFFHLAECAAHDAVPRHEDEVERLCEFMLMQPERFAQQPAGAAANDGVANLAARHYAEAGGRAGGKRLPIGDEAAVDEASAGLSDAGEFPALFEAQGAIEQQALGRGGGHDRPLDQTGVSRLRPTRRRLAKVALPLLVELRFKNPCCRLRRILDGWYWRFIKSIQWRIAPQPGRTGSSPERERIAMKRVVSITHQGWGARRPTDYQVMASTDDDLLPLRAEIEKW